MELSLQPVQMCKKIIDFRTFLFHCLISAFLCWLNHTAVKALDGLGVLWLGQPLDGRAYKEDRCCTLWTSTTADYLNLKLLCRRLASYTAKWSCFCTRIDCCFACFTTYLARLSSEIIKRCFWFAFPLHSQLSPLSSDPLMLSLFLTGSDLLSNTFQHPTPMTDSNLSQRTLPFYFCPFSGILSSSATVEHRGFNPCFFQPHLLIRASLISSQPRAVICSGLWWLFVIPTLCVPAIVRRFVLFFWLLWHKLHWLDVEESRGNESSRWRVIFNFQIYISGSSGELFFVAFSAGISQ